LWSFYHLFNSTRSFQTKFHLQPVADMVKS
jgi:hypothetical protein